MKLLPDNIKPDKYLGKGAEYLYLFLGVIILILIILLFGIFYKDISSKGISLGDIGSILSGTIGTMVAILVAVFTFLAFYVQYDANKKIQEQFRVQQFEDVFYTMLDLHKSNISEMNISFFDHITEERFVKKKNGKISSTDELSSTEFLRYVEGSKMFPGMIVELESTIQVVLDETSKLIKINFKKYPNIYEYLLRYAYRIFFYGIGSEQAFFSPKFNFLENNIIDRLISIQKKFYERHKLGFYNRQSPTHFKFYPFEGHESRLSHYYRNLFAIVKLIVEKYDDEYSSPNYNKARNYLKLLRAQLSNAEQHLLYYNYRIGFGEEWDKLGVKHNQYFTKYRMIHNLPVDRIKIPESPRIHFSEYIKSNEVSLKDPLFEWGDFE